MTTGSAFIQRDMFIGVHADLDYQYKAKQTLYASIAVQLNPDAKNYEQSTTMIMTL